jgi:hypothetical protein
LIGVGFIAFDRNKAFAFLRASVADFRFFFVFLRALCGQPLLSLPWLIAEC